MRRLPRIILVLSLSAAALALPACGSDDERDDGPVSTIEAGPVITLTGETTAIELDGVTVGGLETAGISIEPVAPAKRSGDSIVMPIVGGSITNGTLAGKIENEGGIAFVADGKKIEYTDLTIDTAVGQVFAGPGQTTPVFDLDTRALDSSDDAGVIVISDVVALLSAAAARELNAGLEVSAFQPKQIVGPLTVRAAGS